MGQVPARWAATLLADPDRPVFGVAGSANFRFLAGFRAGGGRYVPAQHEAGAVAMAAGWAAASGGVGVASTHQGPGFTNALTALIDADRGGVPVVLVSGHVDDRGHHQHVDTIAACDALGIAILAPVDVDVDVDVDVEGEGEGEGPTALAEALAWAQAAQRSIVLIPPAPPSSGRPSRGLPVHAVSPQATVPLTEELVQRIAESERVGIVAGRGALRSGAIGDLRQLAQHLDAVLATSAPAQGAFWEDERCVGIIGGFASPAATAAIQSCDVVLAFGASLDGWSTAGGRAFSASCLVVRIDPRAVGNGDVRADAATTARAMLAALPSRAPKAWAREAAAAARRPRAFAPSAGPLLDPRTLMRRLDEMLPANRRIVYDSGHFIAVASMLLTCVDGPHVLFGQDFQSVGLGLARAIGAASTEDDRVTVCVIGDGGAGMSILELVAAVDLGLSLLVVVVNDAAYGAEVHDFAPVGVPVSIAQFPIRDWAGVARALAARAATVRQIADLAAVEAWLVDPSGPLVLDCRVDPQVDATSIMTQEGIAEWSLAD
ncbi:MAG: hypothetical protein KGP12_08950 [Actinomycetales bacterium]|nr:hypothetical protein [Actinomycetales bacterium]